MKQLTWLFAAVVLLLTCTGCTRTAKWEEEVKLSDGQVITLSRAVTYKYDMPAGERYGWLSTGEQLAFNDPNLNNKISWKHDLRTAYYFDRLDGRFWIVAQSRACFVSGIRQRQWVAYVYDGKEWFESTPDSSHLQTIPNLIFRADNYKITSSLRYVSLKEKAEINNSSNQ